MGELDHTDVVVNSSVASPVHFLFSGLEREEHERNYGIDLNQPHIFSCVCVCVCVCVCSACLCVCARA